MSMGVDVCITITCEKRRASSLPTYAPEPISSRLLTQMMNAATFVFAGHDTTANTMTWLLFEVRKHASQTQKNGLADRQAQALTEKA